jgi:hypothetical protein
MNQEEYFDGKAAKDKAVKESERSDMKQHADKLYQGYKKLKESDTKRAIWELFQNAIDLSEYHCEIVIEEMEDGLAFTHNGKLFSSNTLISLLKQVSSKSIKSNKKEVGQYGTGFLTTHCFGRKILLNSFMEEAGRKIKLNHFIIDRSCEFDQPEQLIDKLIEQRDRVFELLEKADHDVNWKESTTFIYQHETEQQKINAKRALDKMEVLLPYVMLFNNKLSKITIKRIQSNLVIFEKVNSDSSTGIPKADYKTLTIRKNDELTTYFYLQSEEKDQNEESSITLILPLTVESNAGELNNEISRLFLYFPLIGTESFGFNCIVHSPNFKCTEPRDSIYLSSNSEANSHDEVINQGLIKLASELLFNFLKHNSSQISNPIHFARVNFNRTIKEVDNENEQLLASYFENLQEKWINEIMTISLVEVQHGRISPEEASFFSPELLHPEHRDAYSAIYKLAAKYWKNVPKESIAVEWTEIVSNWKYSGTKYVTIDLLLKNIADERKLNNLMDLENELKEFYQYLIKIEKTELFKQYKILPNIDNDFIDLITAKLPENIKDVLLPIAKVLIPSITSKFIREDFVFDFKIEVYDRKSLDTDIKTRNTELDNQLNRGLVLDNSDLTALVSYCSIFPKLENKGKRGEIIRLLSDFYTVPFQFKDLPNVADKELDFVPATRNLLKDFILRLRALNAENLKIHLEVLHSILELTFDSSEYKATILSLPVYPNQLFKLTVLTQLSKDEGIPPEIKKLYNEVVFGSKKMIESELLLSRFNDVIQTLSFKSPKYLANEIYKKFCEAGKIDEINKHKYETEIMDIIRRMSSDADWSHYFPEIYAERSIILMKKVTNGTIKDSLFKIIGSGDKNISILGSLAERTDLDHLIRLGNQAIEAEKRYNADFAHKKTIGVHIEDLVREKIGSEVNWKIRVEDKKGESVTVDEMQGGQDIIVEVKGEPFYYIEVKSRWDSGNSVYMSKLQLEKASKNKAKYALCSVDMTKYVGENRYDVREINEILEHIKFVDTIGGEIEPLIASNLIAEENGGNVTLTDYRGLIKQDIILSGKPLYTFVTELCQLINNTLIEVAA